MKTTLLMYSDEFNYNFFLEYSKQWKNEVDRVIKPEKRKYLHEKKLTFTTKQNY